MRWRNETEAEFLNGSISALLVNSTKGPSNFYHAAVDQKQESSSASNLHQAEQSTIGVTSCEIWQYSAWGRPNLEGPRSEPVKT